MKTKLIQFHKRKITKELIDFGVPSSEETLTGNRNNASEKKTRGRESEDRNGTNLAGYASQEGKGGTTREKGIDEWRLAI